MALAPVVLFVYNRPWHTQQTLEALAKNDLADQSKLYIYADGPKDNATQEDLLKIQEVEKIVYARTWCGEQEFIKRDRNWGLADNIVDGVTTIVNKHGKIIVLEDDIVTSMGFLKYMNDALSIYENEEKVMHVTGHSFPLISRNSSETYFLKYVSPWGWGTWKNAWDYFERNALDLYNRLESLASFNLEDFNSNYGNEFYNQLDANVKGTLYTWAIKWHTSIYLQGGLCLFPRQTLVNNIGFDGSGINCPDISSVAMSDLAYGIKVEATKPVINKNDSTGFRNYYLKGQTTNKYRNLVRKIYGRFQSVVMGKK